MLLLANIMDTWITFCALLVLLLNWKDRIRPFFRNYRDWEKFGLISLASCLLLVLGLSLIGAWRKDGDAFFDGLFTALRVLFEVFEGDSETFRGYALHLPVLYGILSVAVPGLTAFTAVTLLWNYLPHRVPGGAKFWHIFSELDANSVRMAKELSDDGHLCIFLRTRRDKADPELLKDIQNINYFLYPGDETRFLHWKPRRSRFLRFYFLLENTDTNFDRMRNFLVDAKEHRLFTPCNAMPDGVEFQQELYLLSETESAPMLIDKLRDFLSEDDEAKMVFPHTELYLLDRFRATSYELLMKKPLHSFVNGRNLNVLVLGFGKIGREFFRTASHMGVIHGCTTTFTLCDMLIREKLDRFLSQCPELDQSVCFQPKELDLETAALEDLLSRWEYHYILVALGDDERNIRVASRLKRFYRLRHWQSAVQNKSAYQPQICVNIEDFVKHEYTRALGKDVKDWDRSLHVFGGLDQVFTPDVLIPTHLWRTARWLHQNLRLPDASEHNTDWREYQRRSSIACAAHAACHTAAVENYRKNDPNHQGQTYLQILQLWRKETLPDDRSLYEHFIDTEHRRWMAYVRSEGLRKASTELMMQYFEPLKKHHVDIAGMLTPCLVDTQAQLDALWGKLSDMDDSYKTKTPFRKRDELLILNAETIQNGIANADSLPEEAITSY